MVTLRKLNRKSRQISMPKEFMEQFDTDTYQCFTEGNKCTYIPITISVIDKKKKKTSLEDAIEELDKALDKVDWENLPSLEEQLKDV
jgi:deoxyadenosine/deoxycytidine kinase